MRRASSAGVPSASSAASEHRYAVAQRLCFHEVVRAQNHRAAPCTGHLANRIVELLRGDRVQPSRRLIEKEQVGIVHERTGERQPLLHAAAEAAHTSVGAISDPELGEQRVDPRSHIGARHVVHLGERAQRLHCR